MTAFQYFYIYMIVQYISILYAENWGLLIILSTPLRPLSKWGGGAKFFVSSSKKKRVLIRKNECDFRNQRPRIVQKIYFISKQLFEGKKLLTSVIEAPFVVKSDSRPIGFLTKHPNRRVFALQYLNNI